MRKLLFLGLVAAVLFGMASVAYAGGYLTPEAGISPHRGYADATTYCKQCHAVHNASATGEVLLRTNRATACVYCHVSATYSIFHPYGTTVANYTDDDGAGGDNFNHSATHQTSTYAGCVNCHTVHGGNALESASEGITNSKYILKKNPAILGNGAIVADATNLTEFCQDCHNREGDNVAAGCYEAACHGSFTGYEDSLQVPTKYFLATRNGYTHIMTTTLMGATGSTQVAWRDSATCYTCHSAGLMSRDTTSMPVPPSPHVEANSFPHYTTGNVQFLSDAGTTENTFADAVCLNCHVQGGDGGSYTTGVGKTF